MNLPSITYLTLPVACLWAAGFLPSRWANRHATLMRRLVTGLAGLQCLAALGYAVVFLGSGSGVQHDHLWGKYGGAFDAPLAASLYYDGATSLMFLLVSFVGWIICRYSVRYLDGEATQGRYFRWTAFTIGSVSWMILAGNLLMFFAAWVATSLGLHQLLLHYGQRPAARCAAWTKFAISRLGDLALLGALVLTYTAFRTFDFAELFAAVDGSSGAGALPHPTAHWIGWLLVLGAVTKSAQLPFHSWLPQTMETPTPVSALMHAGIVNAGGYLVIRTSPLISLTPSALICLAAVGAATACFASVVMLTQTSIKRSLAYSTIAQMGFMMLQCGLGAFSAAMLHILAHSLYKAHAFLGSGGVLTHRAAMDGGKLETRDGLGGGRQLAIRGGPDRRRLFVGLIRLWRRSGRETGRFGVGLHFLPGVDGLAVACVHGRTSRNAVCQHPGRRHVGAGLRRELYPGCTDRWFESRSARLLISTRHHRDRCGPWICFLIRAASSSAARAAHPLVGGVLRPRFEWILRRCRRTSHRPYLRDLLIAPFSSLLPSGYPCPDKEFVNHVCVHSAT